MRHSTRVLTAAGVVLGLAMAGLSTTAAGGSNQQDPQPVEVAELRSETSRVFRHADGQHTLEQYAMPVRVRQGTQWHAVDTTLRFGTDGVVRPTATAVELTLSGGGDGAKLVAIGKEKATVRMGWHGRLPRPELRGDTATYRDVLPGVDLRLRAEPTGFAQVLVVRDRQSAAQPALRRLAFPISGTGVRLATEPDGTTVALDAKGRTTFAAGQAVMWDSANQHAALRTTRVGKELVVEPDQRLLTAPTTRFPLSIDPTWSAGQYLWTHVNQKADTQSYWNYDREEGAKVGYYDGSALYRSLFQMRTDILNGARVIDARFDITLMHSPSGTATPVDLHASPTIDRGERTAWVDTERTHWSHKLDQRKGSSWGSQPDMVMGFDAPAVREYVQWAADDRRGHITFGLRAPHEGDRTQWKRFRGETARIVVKYNNLPKTPRQTGFAGGRCGTAAAPATVNAFSLSASAIASDLDGDNLITRMAVRRADNDELVYEAESGTTTSGAAFSWSPIPPGTLAEGTPYYFVTSSDDRVEGDGAEAGPESPRCYFVVDSKAPGKPAIESADFPTGSARLPARTPGTVTLRPAAGDTDVAEYVYGFERDRMILRVKVKPDGSAQIPLTLWQPPGGPVAPKDLYVRAADKAGNLGPTADIWRLRARSLTEPPAVRRSDVNGDGRADVSTVIDHGRNRTGIWNLVADRDGGFTPANLAWDSGENGGFGLNRTLPVQTDTDGDGRQDVVLLREEAGRRISLHVYTSDGNRYEGAPTPAWHSGTAAWGLSQARLVAGDIDGDGKGDPVVQLNTGDGGWQILAFRGAAGAPAEWLRTPAGSGEWAHSVPVLADVDGDGRDDLVVQRALGTCRTSFVVYRSSGTDFESQGRTLLESDSYCATAGKPIAADVDGDGRDDILALYEFGARDTGVRIVRADGTLAEGWREAGRFDPARVTLTAADYSGDGKDDAGLIVALDGGGREVFTLTSDGTAYSAPVSRWRETAIQANTGPRFGIEHRTYQLVNRNSGRCLDVFRSGQTDPVAVLQWECNSGLNQRFRIEQQAGTDQYELHPAHGDGRADDGIPRCLDVKDNSMADDAAVLQWKCVGTGNQQVTLDYLEGTSYDAVVRLRFAHSGKCAAVRDGSTADLAEAVQRPCADEAAQQWFLRPALNSPQLSGKYRIKGSDTSWVLDVKDCSEFDPNAPMRMWKEVAGSRCQRWEFQPLGDDVYQVVDPSTSKLIGVSGCSEQNLGRLATFAPGELNCTRWRVEPAVNGTWSFVQESSGKAMDVEGCSKAEGASLVLWRYWNGGCQRYALDR